MKFVSPTSIVYEKLWIFFIASTGFALVVFINGAIPGYALPTLGQALWISGFADSLAQGDFFSFRATHFGNPNPVSIAFGLPAAILTSLFIRFGLHATDAYSLSFAVWYLISFSGATRLLTHFGIQNSIAFFGSTLWLILPVVWQHGGYSALSLSMALLPFYLYSAVKVVEDQTTQNIVLFYVCCVLSLFMDGYGFMFFFCCAMGYSSMQSLYTKTVRFKEGTILFTGFLLAYLSYYLYLGEGSFGSSPLDFFRGWGLDVSFALIPTKGQFFIPDLFSLSISRSSRDFFGDASVYLTTFSIFLLLPATLLFFTPIGDRKTKITFFVLGVAGFYMALGPSFKWFSFRPEGYGSLMPAELALGPTGTAIISQYLPGFDNLRASYRWIAVALLGAWLLCIYTLTRVNIPKIFAWLYLSICITIIFPHPLNLWNYYSNNRAAVHDLERELKPLGSLIKQGEKVAFVPTGNDFLINYLAPLLNMKSYNIGGDKNLNLAKQYWPASLLKINPNIDDNVFSYHIFRLLENNDANAIALSKIDLLKGAHMWPTKVGMSKNLQDKIRYLRDSGAFEVIDSKYFQVVRLRKDLKIKSFLKENCEMIGICIRKNTFDSLTKSQTGQVIDGEIHSNGGAGFLHFGPYTPLKAGKYRVTITGELKKISSGFIDVLSENGTTHFKVYFSDIKDNGRGELYSGELEIEKDVDNLEVRIFVNADEEVILRGYRLEAVE
jgi:hypothetical protein